MQFYLYYIQIQRNCNIGHYSLHILYNQGNAF